MSATAPIPRAVPSVATESDAADALAEINNEAGCADALGKTYRELAELKTADRVRYELEAKQRAKNLGVSFGALDDEVTNRLPKSARTESLQGSAVLFDEPEPWPEPVGGNALLADLTRIIAAYVHLPDGSATAISLWVVAAHAFDDFQHAPRLNVTAATRGCGKTLLLDVLGTLCPRALRIENLTQAVLFRIIAKELPTLLIDECDRHLRDNAELIGLLNAGFTRGGVVPRCEGDQNEVRLFPVFAPVALSGIGALPGTLHDRSIVIKLERARPGEVTQRFDSRHVEHETDTKRQIMRWATDNKAALAAADPEMPQAFNRVADVWRPLFAVAQVVGGDWPGRCTCAFQKLLPADDHNEALAIQLLSDVAAVMDGPEDPEGSGQHPHKVATLPSGQLIEALAKLDERPWPTWNHGKPISARQVARMLSGFGIQPAPRRVGDAVFRGYHRTDFADPLARYVFSVTPLQPAPDKGSSNSASVTAPQPVTDRKSPEAAPPLGCNPVTDKSIPIGANI